MMENFDERDYIPPEIAEKEINKMSEVEQFTRSRTAKGSGRGFYDAEGLTYSLEGEQGQSGVLYAENMEEALRTIEKNPNALVLYFDTPDKSVLVAKNSGRTIMTPGSYKETSLYDVWEPGLGPVGFSTSENIEKYLN